VGVKFWRNLVYFDPLVMAERAARTRLEDGKGCVPVAPG
jgi:hypothetical protein